MIGKAAKLRLLALVIAVALVVALVGYGPARAPRPVTRVSVPGRPFQALFTRGGSWILASVDTGIAVLQGSTLRRVVPVDGAPAGMVVTHDGKRLIVAAEDRLALFDVDRLLSGASDALLGYLGEPGRGPLGRVYVNVTADDRYLFSSDERAQTITVVDLAKGFTADAVVGHIPVGQAPIALTLSSDGRYLYTTSQAMPPSAGWPLACRREGAAPSAPLHHTHGAVIVVDVARAERDPESSVVASVPAGCNPVRLVLSPDGARAYVTARGDDALLAFDTRKLIGDPDHALVASVQVGAAPVGVAAYDNRIVVTSSNRFAGGADDRQPLYVIDATRLAVLGTILAGAFPRELRVSPDGNTLLLTNYRSQTIELVDLARVGL